MSMDAAIAAWSHCFFALYLASALCRVTPGRLVRCNIATTVKPVSGTRAWACFAWHLTVSCRVVNARSQAGAQALLRRHGRMGTTGKQGITMSNQIDTNSLLVQLRSMARDAGIPQPAAEADSGLPAFSGILKESLEKVNLRSSQATQLRESFEAGVSDVELSDVMVAMQKARISFEALTQVRNKMVSAYKDIMNMPL